MAKYIPKVVLEKSFKSFKRGDIWQVHQLTDKRLIVFLYFDRQIDSNKALPVYETMKDEYFRLVKQYLDTKVLSPNDISILFDSKENFENKYEGNWYHYYH